MTDGVAMVVDLASGSGSTGARVAGIRPLHTLLVLADVASVAVVINHTLRPTAGDRVRLGDEARQALTDCIVIGAHAAGGSLSTGLGVAGVRLLNALLVLTDVAVVAVRVVNTLGTAASDGVGLGNISRQAVADWSSQPTDFASGSRTTGAGIAGIRLLHTLLVLADKTGAAVIISLALRATSSDGVRLGDETGQAVADGVACIVN